VNGVDAAVDVRNTPGQIPASTHIQYMYWTGTRVLQLPTRLVRCVGHLPLHPHRSHPRRAFRPRRPAIPSAFAHTHHTRPRLVSREHPVQSTAHDIMADHTSRAIAVCSAPPARETRLTWLLWRRADVVCSKYEYCMSSSGIRYCTSKVDLPEEVSYTSSRRELSSTSSTEGCTYS
jgi:hypothetical protein